MLIPVSTQGTACAITLESETTSAEDQFSFRVVALTAYSILETCEIPGLGGRVRLGTEGFFVRVDATVPQYAETQFL